MPRTPPRRYISGETHLYLGRQYRLKIVAADEPRVRLMRGRLLIETPQPSDTERNAELLRRWYLLRAHIKCREQLESLFPTFRRLGFEAPDLSVRTMRRRWGSLSREGRLTLNSDLIKAPRPCIDYVIIHELCHLVHDDHSTAFYQLLERVMPDWQKRKDRLEKALV